MLKNAEKIVSRSTHSYLFLIFKKMEKERIKLQMASLAAILLLSISIILVIIIIPFTAPVSASTSTTSIDVEKWVKYKDEPDTEYRKTIDDAKVCDTVTFKIAIHNDGSTPLTDIWIQDFLDCNLEYIEGSANVPPVLYDNECPDLYQYFRWEFPELEPDEFLNITFDAHVEESGNDRNEVYVDAEDSTGVDIVDDVDTVWVTCEVEDKPDLEIVDKWEEWVDDTHYNVTYVIHNNGTATALAGHNTTLYVDSAPIEHKHVPEDLAPYETYEDTFDTVIECTDESDAIKVCADNYDVVDELDEDNNCLENVWSCLRKPDLVIVDKWENWVNETHYNVTYVIHNSGTVVAPGCHNTTLYVDGAPIEHKHVPVPLAPCETYTDTFDTVIECTGESDTIRVCADNYEVVDELNENNNCLENVWFLRAMPGISVNKVADPISGVPSTKVTFTISVENIGGSTLNPVTVVDTLPGGMSYVSSSPAGSRVGNTITWNVGPLASETSETSETITLVAHIDEGAVGMLENVVTATGTPPAGADVTGSDTAEIEVLARTIEPPTQTLIDISTEVKSDGIVIEGEQFGWETGNGNLLNNPPLSPGEAVGGIKYDEKMIGSNGTTEFGKEFAVNTNATPNLEVTKDIGYKSGDLGSLSHAEQAGMRYSGASPPLSSDTKCEDVNAYSEMVVTDVEASTETEVGITETDERDLHYGINAEGKGSVSAGVDASAEERVDRGMSYEDKSTAYGGNFSFEKNVDYTSKKTSTSITTDLKGDSTVVEEGQFRGERGSRSLLHNDKMIGSNGTTEFEKCVDASTTNLEVDKSIVYKSGDMGSLSHAEQVGMQYSSKTKCRDVNAHSKMVVTNATTETEARITRKSLHYGIDAEGKGSVSAGVDAFVKEGRSDISYKGKSIAYGNFTFDEKVDYTTKSSTSITTDLKGDRTVVEEGQFGWGSGNENLKYDEKMIGSNGTTEFDKCFDVDTGTAPNLEVDKSIGYKSGDLGSLSHSEQVGMRYSGDEVNAYSEMVVTDVEAATETEVGRDLLYETDAKGSGSVSAGVDASVEDGHTDMTYTDKSNAYGGNFTFEKKVGYKSKPP